MQHHAHSHQLMEEGSQTEFAHLAVLLENVHQLMRIHHEAFTDLFSRDSSKAVRCYFLSLGKPDQDLLTLAAVVDALLNAD